MNMSLTKLDTLIDEFPEEAQALERLVDLLKPRPGRNDRREYSPARMYDLIQPTNFRVLVQILSSATQKGLIKRIIRVVSPTTGGGIGDFESIVDIPDFLLDIRVGREIEVTTDSITMVYEILPDNH